MITVSQAEKFINDNVTVFPALECTLEDACGLVLREDILADRDYPPYDRIMMDGIAISFSAWKESLRRFKILDMQRAGEPAKSIQNKDEAIEIMTGAVLPHGCDCVIKIEDIDLKENIAVIPDDLNVMPQQHVHKKGSDKKKDDLLIKAGCLLNGPKIGVCASVGKSSIKISYKPKIAIVSTGDEIVDHKQNVEPHQMRKSNSYAIKTLIEISGLASAYAFHIRDDKKQLFSELKIILDQFDIVLITGGVSMGKFDFIPEVLGELGVRTIFHKVRQKPGKPLLFGKDLATKPVFGLPGNPVSAQVCAVRYVLPYLKKALAMKEEVQQKVILANDFTPNTSRTYFCPVSLENYDGKILAHTIDMSCSGDFAALVKSDGFVEMAYGKEFFVKGEVVPFFNWKF